LILPNWQIGTSLSRALKKIAYRFEQGEISLKEAQELAEDAFDKYLAGVRGVQLMASRVYAWDEIRAKKLKEKALAEYAVILVDLQNLQDHLR